MAVRFAPLDDDDPTRVAGYDLRARLGAGGMGRVYLAFSPGGRALAVKVVRPDYAQDEEFRRRFRKEIDAAQRVQGLYTAPVVDADSEAKLPWLATAYVPGPTLHQAVTEHGPLPLLTVFRLLAGVAEGLTAIHGCELIHRDLKPANILLAEDGPRVIDFGIAHAADATTLTSTHIRVGTPAFMAPEQIRGRSATPATDVFALGNLAVFAATGRTAFGEGNPDALFYRIFNEAPELDDCPPTLRAVVERCLARDPGERPAVSEIMEYARKQTTGQTLALAGSWLPEAVERSLAGYDTKAYVPPKTKKAGQGDTAPRTAETEKKDTAGGKAGARTGGGAGVKPPAGGGEARPVARSPWLDCSPRWRSSSSARTRSSARSATRLKESPSPSSTYSTPSYTSSPDVNAQATGLTGGSGTSTPEPTEDATPDGCARGNQVFRSNLDMYDKASAASLSSLASSLDSAASDAGDSEVASALRDLADDARALSDAASRFDAALNRRDSSQAETYKDAFSSARQEWEDDAETFKSVCS
ncbi:serine/threonine-protein kinase [Streptomyces lydicamycinicus]|uniref:serine/threonine-protein kinase n=1 Tax=Streptomyces lydicamycinicus TaxID=1546107 RepID=UPI003D8016E3